MILLVARVTESLPSRAEWLKRRSFVAAILAFRLNQSAEPLLNAARSSTFVSPAHIDGSGSCVSGATLAAFRHLPELGTRGKPCAALV